MAIIAKLHSAMSKFQPTELISYCLKAVLGWDHFTILQHSLYFGALILKNFNQLCGGLPIHCGGCLKSAVLSESTWFTCQIIFFSIDTVMSLLRDFDRVTFCLDSSDLVLYRIQILNFD